MKKALLLISLIFACNYYANSQNIYPRAFDNCEPIAFFLEGLEIYTEYDDSQLLHDLIDDVSSKILNKTRGEIHFQVVVDSLGNHCCVSINDELNKHGKKLNFKKLIDEETSWKTPIIDGEKQNVSAMVRIVFTDDKIIISRIGFNGKAGWDELSRYEYIKE